MNKSEKDSGVVAMLTKVFVAHTVFFFALVLGIFCTLEIGGILFDMANHWDKFNIIVASYWSLGLAACIGAIAAVWKYWNL